MSSHTEAPTRWKDVLRYLGPGLIITATIVGSGELIATPKLASEEGFTLLWFIIIGCLLKVFVQIELGRFAIARGMTTLEAMNSIPGPRFIVSWLLWLWVFMYVALVFQVAGMVGGITEIIGLAGFNLERWIGGVLTAGSCGLLLVTGKYRVVERGSMLLVAAFAVCTVVAVAALQWTPAAITGADLAHGLSFQMPKSFTTAFGAFGIIGVGASELIYYPYWCLEKGYARRAGPREESADWFRRAQGWIRVMKTDAWISLVIYTGATVAFYLLGAAVLWRMGKVVDNNEMIETLSHMYQNSFGTWGMAVFLVGAFVVLYSTIFGATASNARLLADALSLFRVVNYSSPESRRRMIGFGCLILPFASLFVYLAFGSPVSLVFVGAIAQGLMLPFLAMAALYFRFKRIDAPLRPGRVWTSLLALSAAAMIFVGAYQVVSEVSKRLQPAPPAASSATNHVQSPK